MARHASLRTLAALVAVSQIFLGCPRPNPPLALEAGLPERRSLNLVAVPGGRVDVAGGKLIVRRTDLELDTRLGTERFGAVWDSALGRFVWSFELTYDGSFFTDATGATWSVAALGPEASIPGTHWVKLDAARMQTKGGLVHEFDGAGRLVARYWRSDPYPRIRHDHVTIAGASRTASIAQCSDPASCTALFTLSYDAAGRLVGVLDRAGRSAEYVWDADGQLVVARDALDVSEGWPGFRYAYAGGQLTAITNSEGEQVVYGYRGRALERVTQVGPSPRTHRFQHQGKDPSGIYHTRYWNPQDEEQRFAYDAEGRLLEQLVVATGDARRITWSGERRNTETLPSGATTRWTWSADDLVTRTDPSGNVVSYAWAPTAVNREDPGTRAVASVTDSLGLVETRSYDAAGRLTEQRNGAGEVTTYAWVDGALASETRSGVTRSFEEVGEHGHAARITVQGLVEERTFDAVGNRLLGSNGREPLAGGMTRRSFDADRNLTGLELAPSDPTLPSETVTLRYRSDGQRLSVARGGDDEVFLYDAFGRLVERREQVDGVWQATVFGYDGAGRPAFAARPNGMRREVVWGPGDRLHRVRHLRDGILESQIDLVWQDGLLVEVTDAADGTERYAYDAAGRRVSTVFPEGEQLLEQHDLRSRLASEMFVASDGAILGSLSYAHDLADRRVRVADAAGMLLETDYEDGRVVERRFGNGLVRTFGYQEGVLQYTQTLDAAGNEVEWTTLSANIGTDASGRSVASQRATTWTYGGVDVMTVEQYELAPLLDSAAGGPRISQWSDGMGAVEDYAFDARSNLVAAGDRRFVYNAEGNRLLGIEQGGEAVGAYVYDAAGFVTERDGRALTWSAAGQLTGHGDDRFEWDGLGRLREVEVAGVTAHLAFGGRVARDAAGVPAAVDLGTVVASFGGLHRYRHLDFRGNVKWVSDAAGAVVAHYRYGPFGLDAVFGADDDPVRFVARPEIGELMLLGARVYDPSVGRFLSPDPLFQAVNAYAYTLGNPIWFSDADGRSPDPNGASESIALALEAIGNSLSAVGVVLSMSPDARAQALGAALILIGTLLVLLAVAIRLLRVSRTSVRGTSFVSGGGGASGGGGSTGDLGTGDIGGCSPAALSAGPVRTDWLRFLLPLQLLLGLLWLRRRRRSGAATRGVV